MQVYNAMVLPLMTYGCERCSAEGEDKAKLQAAGMKVLSKVAGVTRLDCIRSDDNRERSEQETLIL